MSIHQFYSSAKCRVSTEFNLKDYVTSLTDFISNHIDSDTLEENLVREFENKTYDSVYNTLMEFFIQTDDELRIVVNAEIQSTLVYDWLRTQLRDDVMISTFMTVQSTSISSWLGCEIVTFYVKKGGEFISSDGAVSILEQYEKMSA